MLLQAGGSAALAVTTLRSQPNFLQCVVDCVTPSPPDSLQTAGGHGTQASHGGSAPWQLLAEAHALTILTTEAFLCPREAGDGVCLSSYRMHCDVASAGLSNVRQAPGSGR